MRKTRMGRGRIAGRWLGAALVSLGLLALAGTGAQAYTFTLDAGVFPSEGSLVRPINPGSTATYTTGTEFELNVSSLTDGASVVLEDFVLATLLPGGVIPIGDALNPSFVSFSLAEDGNGSPVPDATLDVTGELVAVSGSSGFFDIVFDEFVVYYEGESGNGFNVQGSFGFVLSTQLTRTQQNVATTIRPFGDSPAQGQPIDYANDPSATIFGGDGMGGDVVFTPTACDGGNPAGFDYPTAPLTNGTDFSAGSRLTLGGQACPSGLSAIVGGTEKPFLIELTGVVVPEPGTLMLMSLGLVGLSVGRRRSRV